MVTTNFRQEKNISKLICEHDVRITLKYQFYIKTSLRQNLIKSKICTMKKDIVFFIFFIYQLESVAYI